MSASLYVFFLASFHGGLDVQWIHWGDSPLTKILYMYIIVLQITLQNMVVQICIFTQLCIFTHLCVFTHLCIFTFMYIYIYLRSHIYVWFLPNFISKDGCAELSLWRKALTNPTCTAMPSGHCPHIFLYHWTFVTFSLNLNAVHYRNAITVHCIALHSFTIQYIALHSFKVQYNALHCIAM